MDEAHSDKLSKGGGVYSWYYCGFPFLSLLSWYMDTRLFWETTFERSYQRNPGPFYIIPTTGASIKWYPFLVREIFLFLEVIRMVHCASHSIPLQSFENLPLIQNVIQIAHFRAKSMISSLFVWFWTFWRMVRKCYISVTSCTKRMISKHRKICHKQSVLFYEPPVHRCWWRLLESEIYICDLFVTNNNVAITRRTGWSVCNTSDDSKIMSQNLPSI